MCILENGVLIYPGRMFYCRLVLKAEVDSKSSWSAPSSLCWTSLLVFYASTPSSKFFMTLSNVPKQDNIIRM